MKIKIRKRNYAKGIMPWCPYVGGFWYHLRKRGISSFYIMGYQIDIKLKKYTNANFYKNELGNT